MYKLANSARKAMQDKAKRLTTADPHQKVDSSTWSPAEPLDAEAKTGARPLVRRIYKSGGKVQGGMAKKRADRTARKSGGRTAPWVDDLINRDVRTANEAREGKKHVGAFKKGGRAKHATKGKVNPMTQDRIPRNIPYQGGMVPASEAMTPAESMTPDDLKLFKNRLLPRRMKNPVLPRGETPEYKNMPLPRGETRSYENMKKGGKVSHMEWEHSKEDLKQDKKLAKKHGMSLEKWEKSALDKKHDKQQSAEGLCYGGKAKKASGGKVFSGNSTTKVPGAVGGRDARKRGGKTKGKTNISINIMPQAGGAPMPPMGMNPPMPPAMPSVAPPAGAPPAGAPPMGGQGIDPSILVALASGMGGGAPAPVPAPAYKKGGRTAKQVGGPMNAGMIQQTRPMPAGGMINPISRAPTPIKRPGAPSANLGSGGDSRLSINPALIENKPPRGLQMPGGGPAPRMIPGPNDFSMGPGGSLVRPGPGGGKPAPRMIPGPNDGIMGSLRPMPGAPGQLNNGTIPFPGSDRGPSRPFKKGGRANTKHVIDHASGGGLGRLEKIKAYGEPQKKIK